MGFLDREKLNISRMGMVKKLASVPKNFARKKSVHEERCIGIIFSNATEESIIKIVKGLNDIFQSAGYSFKVRTAGNNQAREERIIKEMLGKKVDGLIVEPSKSQMLCRHVELYKKMDNLGVPYVFLKSSYPQMIDRAKVNVDDSQGSYLLTRHLIATGRENIIGLFKADDVRGYERHKGYVRALQEAGIEYRPELVIWFHSEDRFKKPFVVLDHILKQNKEVDGVLCYNDMMARAVVDFLEQLGLAVPEDVAVTGYGNSNLAGEEGISITSVNIPDYELGFNAGQILMAMLQGTEITNHRGAVLNPEIVIRGSSVK